LIDLGRDQRLLDPCRAFSDRPVKTPHRDVRFPESPNSTPVTCWLPASTVAPVVASVVFALVFSV